MDPSWAGIDSRMGFRGGSPIWGGLYKERRLDVLGLLISAPNPPSHRLPTPCRPRGPSSPASGASTPYVWIPIEVLHLEHLDEPPRGAVRGSDWIGEDCTSTLPRLASPTSAQHSASSGNPVIYNCSSSLVVAVEIFDLR